MDGEALMLLWLLGVIALPFTPWAIAYLAALAIAAYL